MMPRTIKVLLLLGLLVSFGTSCGRSSKTASATPEIIKSASGIEMVRLPGGWFEMGSEDDEADESPVHRVWVDPFLMDRCEVTQEEYERLMKVNPSHFRGPRNPVDQVSWAQAALYCNARSRIEGLEPCYDEETAECNFEANGYRLPTEAEWEYACRAGTSTGWFFGRDKRRLKEYAWYSENSFGKTHPVAQRKPNPWGLFDLYGNVAEWCNDIYGERYYANSPERNPRGPTEGKRYILRGGSWNASAESCRSAYRADADPGFGDACFARDDIGFRCVRQVEPH